MRREDHRVQALQRVDAGVGRCEFRIGRRHQRGDDAGRLRVLDDAALGNFLDDPGALLPQGVAQHAENLHALGFAPSGSPRRLSSMLMATMRLNVFSLAVAQPSAWHRRSMRAWS